MKFSEVIGQGELKQKLIQSVIDNRISHAQMFLGNEGNGKLAVALAFAQFIMCENKQQDDSCGECSSCKRIQKLIHPDLHFSYPIINVKSGSGKPKCTDFIEPWRNFINESKGYPTYQGWLSSIEADNKQGNIPISECHDIIHKLNMKSYESEFKILIMWLPEFLGKEGNALLKLIEEPPNNTLFLFVAEDADKILNTIVSRTQIVKVPRLNDEDLSVALKDHGVQDDGQMSSIVRLANGNWNKAKALLNKEVAKATFSQWLANSLNNRPDNIFQDMETISHQPKEEQKDFLLYGLSFFRELLLFVSTNSQHQPNCTDNELILMQKLQSKVTVDSLKKVSKLFDQSHYHIERNANSRILFMNLAIQTKLTLL